MIIIPALGRTRSSLVTGIFHACGAWVGDTTVSIVRKYDSFENWDVIKYLQSEFGLRGPMSNEEAKLNAPALREFVTEHVPDDRLVVLKCIWYYHLLFGHAFPDATYYRVSRVNFTGTPPKLRKRIGMMAQYKRETNAGAWIDSEKLVASPPDFSQMRSIIDQHSALQWNSQAIDTLYASNGSKKYSKRKRMRRK